MILDRYYKNPIIWDLILTLCICGTTSILENRLIFTIPKKESLISLTTDLSSISLTISGFILTLLTVLITFKSTENKYPNTETPTIENNSVFNLFFHSRLYFKTVSILKNCIKILVLISIVGYTFKLFVESINSLIFFYFNELSLVLLVLTVFRCLFILVKIIEIQEDN